MSYSHAWFVTDDASVIAFDVATVTTVPTVFCNRNVIVGVAVLP